MKQGRKPKPTQMKVISGTDRADRRNLAEPKPVANIPDAPSHLTGAAVAEWNRVVEEMASLRIISNLDRGALAAYCQAYGRWVVAEESLARVAEKDPASGGLVIKTKSGNYIQNPLVGAANKAMADMVRYAAEFGMTPSARSRIAVLNEDSADDPFANFVRAVS